MLVKTTMPEPKAFAKLKATARARRAPSSLAAAKLLKMRASLIYSEAAVKPLMTGVSGGKNLVSTSGTCAQLCTDARQVGRGFAQPSLPWASESPQRFWGFYTELVSQDIVHLERLTASDAWKRLVPFRVTKILPPIQGPAGEQVVDEGFLFPHGAAYVINITCSGSYALDAAVDQLQTLLTASVFTIQGGIGRKADQIGEAGLQALREQHFDGLDAPTASLPPFTVVTIVEAEGDALQRPITDQDYLHRVLDGLASRSATWRENSLDSLSRSQLASRGRPMSHITYVAKNSRIIWHPLGFASDAPDRARLSLVCFHRNVMFASLQVKSLLESVKAVSQYRQSGGTPVGELNDCIRRACNRLGLLYSGQKSTYRSRSITRQIDDSAETATVNAERLFHSLNPLSP